MVFLRLRGRAGRRRRAATGDKAGCTRRAGTQWRTPQALRHAAPWQPEAIGRHDHVTEHPCGRGTKGQAERAAPQARRREGCRPGRGRDAAGGSMRSTASPVLRRRARPPRPGLDRRPSIRHAQPGLARFGLCNPNSTAFTYRVPARDTLRPGQSGRFPAYETHENDPSRGGRRRPGTFRCAGPRAERRPDHLRRNHHHGCRQEVRGRWFRRPGRRQFARAWRRCPCRWQWQRCHRQWFSCGRRDGERCGE